MTSYVFKFSERFRKQRVSSMLSLKYTCSAGLKGSPICTKGQSDHWGAKWLTQRASVCCHHTGVPFVTGQCIRLNSVPLTFSLHNFIFSLSCPVGWDGEAWDIKPRAEIISSIHSYTKINSRWMDYLQKIKWIHQNVLEETMGDLIILAAKVFLWTT